MSALAYDFNNIIDVDFQNKKVKEPKDFTSGSESKEVYAFKNDKEIEMMINVFDKHIDEAPDLNKLQIARRNKMLFIIGINLGIRGSDINQLKWSHLLYNDMTFKDLDDYTKIKPKKTRKYGKYVYLMFNDAIKQIVNEYITWYPVDNIDEFIFKSRKGNEAISRTTIGRIIKNTAKEAGIKRNINSHSLRKTFGYRVWHDAENKSEALVHLQRIYNHRSQTETMDYIGITTEDISSVFMNLNLGKNFI